MKIYLFIFNIFFLLFNFYIIRGLLFGVREGVMGAVSALGHESLNVLDTLTWLVNKNLN